jgi:diguanylate cyclase (GGDEF)-like protein
MRDVASAERSLARATQNQPAVGLGERWATDSHLTYSELLELKGDAVGALRELKLAEAELRILQRSETSNRVAAMRAVSNANELDYRTVRLEHEKHTAEEALKHKETLISRWILVAAGVALLCIVAGALAWRRHRDATNFEQRLQTDSLTEALSRSAIEAYLTVSVNRAIRTDNALSVLLLDLDAFKKINDTHGHAAGDEGLKWVVRKVREVIRSYDQIGRIGGDEFLVVLPGADIDIAMITTDRIRNAVTEAGPLAFAVSVSVGAASLSKETSSVKAILKRADESMYEVKRKRRANSNAPH